MLKVVQIAIGAVRVPVKRAKTLEQDKVAALAEDILENGLKTPIQVRHDGKRHILVEGLHRLEAMRALGVTGGVAPERTALVADHVPSGGVAASVSNACAA